MLLELNNPLVASFDGLTDLMKIYSELDILIDNFKGTAQVKCLQNCRRCCMTPSSNIEASIFEMIPLAINLWYSGKGDQWLECLDNISSEELR